LRVCAEAFVSALSAAGANEGRDVLAAKVAALSKNSRRFAAIRTSVEIVYNSVFNYKRIVTAESLISFRTEPSYSFRATREMVLFDSLSRVFVDDTGGAMRHFAYGGWLRHRASEFQIHTVTEDQT